MTIAWLRPLILFRQKWNSLKEQVCAMKRLEIPLSFLTYRFKTAITNKQYSRLHFKTVIDNEVIFFLIYT